MPLLTIDYSTGSSDRAALNLAGAVLVYFTVHRTPPAHCLGRTAETQFASWALHLRNPFFVEASVRPRPTRAD